MNNGSFFFFLIMAMFLGFFLFFLGFVTLVFTPWARALLTGGQVSMLQIIGMRLRGTPASQLVNVYVSLLHGNIKTTLSEVEQIYLHHRYQIQDPRDLYAICREELGQ